MIFMLGLHKKKAWFGHEGTGLTRAFFISEIRAWCAWSMVILWNVCIVITEQVDNADFFWEDFVWWSCGGMVGCVIREGLTNDFQFLHETSDDHRTRRRHTPYPTTT